MPLTRSFIHSLTHSCLQQSLQGPKVKVFPLFSSLIHTNIWKKTRCAPKLPTEKILMMMMMMMVDEVVAVKSELEEP